MLYKESYYPHYNITVTSKLGNVRCGRKDRITRSGDDFDQRLKVDLNPLPIAGQNKDVEKVWISSTRPASTSASVPCNCFRPIGPQLKLAIIFRGTGKVNQHGLGLAFLMSTSKILILKLTEWWTATKILTAGMVFLSFCERKKDTHLALSR